MQKHIYMVWKRGKPLSNKKFCSLICLDAQLKIVEPDWKAVAERFEYEDNGQCVHLVTIAEKEKVEQMRHSES